MPNRGAAVGPPKDYVEGTWPDGEPAADAPRALEHARFVAVRLRESLADRSVTEVAEGAALARSTIYDVMGGRTWPDLVSLGKLEEFLEIELLPRLPDEAAGQRG